MDLFMTILGFSLVIAIGSFLWILGYVSTLKGCIESTFGVYPKHIIITTRLFVVSIIIGLISAFVVTFMILSRVL